MAGELDKAFTLNAYKKWGDQNYDQQISTNKLNITAEPLPKLNSIEKIVIAKPNGTLADECINNVKYVVIARSLIMKTGSFDLCKEDFQFELEITSFYAPTFNVIVYYLNKTDYLFVQNLDINVNGIYENKVSLEFDKSKAEPGEAVSLKVKATPGSLAAICVIDQSVSLMKQANELTDDLILNKLFDMKLAPYYPTYEPVDNGEDNHLVFGRFKHSYGYWEAPESKVELQV